MNDFEPKPTAPGLAVAAGAEGLQFQLNLLRAAVILLSGTLAVFVWLQVHYLRVERTRLQPILQSYERDKLTVDPLLAKIAEYGRTRPAFAPLMQKYQLQALANPLGTPAAVKPAAPAAAKPAKPPAAVPKP